VKPHAFTVESPRPVAAAAAVNPVREQMEQLANELNTVPATPAAKADEAYILGGDDAPMVADPYPARETARAITDMPLAPKVEPEKKAGWGFFGRKKQAHDLRQEPRPEPRTAAPAPRPQAQRPPAEEQPAPPSGEDLFPEHNRDEQFEIPAFLRRQSN
jgi:cell division protein FtsZ